MGRGLSEVVEALGLLLPPQVLAAAAILLVLLALPGWLYGVRVRQIRNALRRTVRAAPAQRPALIARAFERAGHNPHLLALIVEDARKRDLPQAAQAALRQLDEHPKGGPLAAKLRASVSRPPPPLARPIEAIARVEALLDGGATEAARAAVLEALEAHPEDPDLAALRARLDVEEASR